MGKFSTPSNNQNCITVKITDLEIKSRYGAHDNISIYFEPNRKRSVTVKE